jgi:hypothetical protein
MMENHSAVLTTAFLGSRTKEQRGGIRIFLRSNQQKTMKTNYFTLLGYRKYRKF